MSSNTETNRANSKHSTGPEDLDTYQSLSGAALLAFLEHQAMDKESDQPDKLLYFMEMHENTGEIYGSTEDGFVFARTQINQAILVRYGERLYDEALEVADSPDE